MNAMNTMISPVDLQQLSIADFEPFLQKSFALLFPGGEEAALLSSVLRLTGYTNLERTPFSVVLQTGQTKSYYPQGIYTLVHPSLGRMEIFLVPLGIKEGGMQYEAVFS